MAGRLAQPSLGGLAALGRGLKRDPSRPLAGGLLIGGHDTTIKPLAASL